MGDGEGIHSASSVGGVAPAMEGEQVLTAGGNLHPQVADGPAMRSPVGEDRADPTGRALALSKR